MRMKNTGEIKGRVLIIDDDEDILDLLKYNLEKEGFKVKTVQKSSSALRAGTLFMPDLIILDIMMPHPNGIELCRQFRGDKQFDNTIIFFLTANSEKYVYHAAVSTGGDDVIDKMMGLRSLTFKINSVLKKRFVIKKCIAELHIGPLFLRRTSEAVMYNGKEIMISKPEFDLLYFFAQNAGRLVSTESLLHLVWGSDLSFSENIVEQFVNSVNFKSGTILIEKLHGHQFRFRG